MAAIISIGKEMDTAVDDFGLPEATISRLCLLACLTRSTNWEKAFSGQEWGLTKEQAKRLSKALLMDITGKLVLFIHLVIHIFTNLEFKDVECTKT